MRKLTNKLQDYNNKKVNKFNFLNKIRSFTDDGLVQFEEKLLPVESTEINDREAWQLSNFKNFKPKYFFKDVEKD